MSGQRWLNIGIVLLLILIEGLFVAAEISLVSLRESQVRAMAETGRRGAIVARLVSDPNRFLAAVQIGVTSTALLSSAFGAVTLSGEAKHFLVATAGARGWPAPSGIVGVTLIISFVTLVVGELAPEAAGPAAPRGRGQAVRAAAEPAGRRLPSGHLAAVEVDQRRSCGCSAATRTPAASRSAEEELRGLVAAHESLSSRRAPPDRRRLRRRRALDRRGHGAAHRRGVPRRRDDGEQGGQARRRLRRTSATRSIGRDQDDVLGLVHIRDLLLGDPRSEPRPHRRRRWPARSRRCPAPSGCSRRCRRCAARATTWPSSSTSTAARTASSRSRTSSRRSSATSATRAARRPRTSRGGFSGGIVELDGKENLDEVAEVSGLELPEGPYATLGGYVMAELGRLPQLHDRVRTTGSCST